MKRVWFLIYFLNIAGSAITQTHFDDQWISGGGRPFRIDFSISPVQTSYFIDTNITIYATGGNSSICDSNGRPILFSDGYNIYDTLGNYINNGDTLVSNQLYINRYGWSTFSQTSILLPFDSNLYYLITPNATDSIYNNWDMVPYVYTDWFNELLIHKIDMNANGGAGKVIVKGSKIMEHEKMLRTMMMVCRHANGKDWWLLKQMYEDSGNFDGLYPLSKNKIAKILITKDSIYPATMQYFAKPDFGFFEQNGQAIFSEDGKKYAATCRGMNKVFLADFDRCTGELINPKTINVPNFSRHDPVDTTLQDVYTEGLCFSPSGQFLYVIKIFNILQYDLWNPDSTTAWHWVAGLDTTWQKFQKYSSSYLGPDNKMYVGNWNGLSKQMSVINNPDIKGTGCNFCPRCLHFPGYGAPAPPCMPNYDLGEDLPCWALGNSQINADNAELVIFPNPASNILYISADSKEKRELYNSVGQLLFSTEENQIDVCIYSRGIYYLKVGNEVRKVVVD